MGVVSPNMKGIITHFMTIGHSYCTLLIKNKDSQMMKEGKSVYFPVLATPSNTIYLYIFYLFEGKSVKNR